MPLPNDEQIAELYGISMLVRTMVEAIASGPNIELSVYYSLYMGTMLRAAFNEDAGFESVMDQFRKDHEKYGQLLKAKNAQELMEIAKFHADVVNWQTQSSAQPS